MDFKDFVGDLLAVSGLTKRELFAAMAMQGLLSYGNELSNVSLAQIAPIAVEQADALLAQLEKKK